MAVECAGGSQLAGAAMISTTRRLKGLPSEIGGRLIGDARVLRAIGQAGEDLAAAEEEIRARDVPLFQAFDEVSDSRLAKVNSGQIEHHRLAGAGETETD